MEVKDKCGNFRGGSGAGREITWEGGTGATPWSFNSGARHCLVGQRLGVVGWVVVGALRSLCIDLRPCCLYCRRPSDLPGDHGFNHAAYSSL